MRRLVAGKYVSFSAQVSDPATRTALRLVLMVLALSFVQLVLSIALSGQYVDWFLAERGIRDRAAAPPGEVAGIYVALGLRSLFSLLWLASYRSFVDLVLQRGRWSLRVLLLYGVVAAAGYGWLASTGGPWWLVGVRCAQALAGLLVLGCCAAPGLRRWSRGDSPVARPPG